MSTFNKSFIINPEKFNHPSLGLYQKLLQEFKDAYTNAEVGQCVLFHEPPVDNKFAEFQLKCSKNENTTEYWSLPWNPLNEVDRNKLRWDYNSECAPDVFKKITDSMFKKLQNSLPGCIEFKTNSFLTDYQVYYDAYPCYDDDCQCDNFQSKTDDDYKEVEDYDAFD